MINLTLLENNKYEPSENIVLTLNDDETSPPSYYVGTPATATLTVTEEDPIPTISVANIVQLVNEGDTVIDIPVVLSNPTVETVLFKWDTIVGTASANDFTVLTDQTNEIIVGTTSIVRIPITEDNIKEGAEEFTVTFKSVDNASFPNGARTYTITVRIVDNEGPTIISFDDAAPSGNESAGEIRLSASLNHVPTQQVTVKYSTADDTAISTGVNADYTTVSNATLTFLPGVTTAEFPITLSQDSRNELNERFLVTLSEPTNAGFADSASTIAATATIIDDDFPALSFKTTSFSVNETGGSIDVDVKLTGLLSQAVTFDVGLRAKTATKFSDYNDPVQTSYLIPLDASETRITIPIVNDTNHEGNETFEVVLFNLSGASVPVGNTLTQAITIVDDETPTVRMKSRTIAVAENVNNGMVNIEFTLSGATNNVVTVTYATEFRDEVDPATNDVDFTVPTTGSNTAMIAANQLTGTISIPILNDSIDEPNETFVVMISNPQNAVLTGNQADTSIQVKIEDDDIPELSITGSGSFTEGTNETVDYTITSDIQPHTGLTIFYFPENRNFLPEGVNGKLQATREPLTFTPINPNDPSVTTATAILKVPLDNDIERDANGQLRVTLRNETPVGVNYTIDAVHNNIALNVLDDDTPELTIVAGDARTEAAGVSAEFEISADISPDEMISVWYDLTENLNFISTEGTGKTAMLDFSNEATSDTLMIPIVNDNNAEGDGTITVTLITDRDPLVKYVVGAAPNNMASVRVFDDDSLPTISIKADNGGIAESAGTANFMLTATGLTTTGSISVNATPSEVSGDFLTDAVADSPSDYSVQFSDADGDSIYTGTLGISLDNDGIHEATGSIKLVLNTKTTVYRLGSTTEGRLTIWDNEAPELRVRVDTESITEGMGVSANFVIETDVSPSDHLNVRYDLTETGDFINIEGIGKTDRLDFTNGIKEQTISVPIRANSYPENDGTITLTLRTDTATPVNYTVVSGSGNSGTIAVIDDESLPVVTMLRNDDAVVESDLQARFVLVATGLTKTSTLMINATPAENGHDFLDDNTEGTCERICC